MTQNEIRERLLELARVRLKARFGAFERFHLTLDGLPAGAAILTRAGLMPAPWTVGLKMGIDGAAKQIDLHFLRLIDGWAQDEVPARQISALDGLETLPAEPNSKTAKPQPTTPSPAPVAVGASGDVERVRAKRRTWRDVAWPYMVEVVKAGQYKTGKEFYQALKSKAGTADSPFDRGTGQHRDVLFVREISETLALKTIQTHAWKELKASRQTG